MTEPQLWYANDEIKRLVALVEAAEAQLKDADKAHAETLFAFHEMKARAEAAEKREAALRKVMEHVLTGREVYRGDHTEIESYDAGTIEDILRAALEAKP